MNRFSWLTIALVFTFAPVDLDAKSDRIGYLQTYTPWILGIVDGRFEEATGYSIEWQTFENGADIINALEKDEIDIGSAGSAPISAALSLGHQIELFWILQDVNFAEGLVVRKGTRIDAPQQLRGKRISVPFASTAHYQLIFALEQFKITLNDIKLSYMSAEDIVFAWEDGKIDAAFVWNPYLDRLLKYGKIMISSGRLGRWGKPTFDGLVADKNWAKQNPKFMVEFVRAIAKIDEEQRSQPNLWSLRSANIKKISAFLDGTGFGVFKSLRLYARPDLKKQASRAWLGGGSNSKAARSFESIAEFLKKHGVIDKVLPDYSHGVTDQWVKRAEGK